MQNQMIEEEAGQAIRELSTKALAALTEKQKEAYAAAAANWIQSWWCSPANQLIWNSRPPASSNSCGAPTA